MGKICAYILLFFMVALPSTTDAQNRFRDSLNRLVRTTTEPRRKIDAMNAVVFDLATTNTDSSGKMAEAVYKLAKKINYHTGMGTARMWLGNSKVFGNPRSYFPLLAEALVEFEKDKNYVQRSLAYSQMARPYLFLSRYDSAVYCARLSVNEIGKDTSNSFKKIQQRSIAYNGLSGAFYMMSILDSSFYYGQKALADAESINDDITLCNALLGLGFVFYDQEKFEIAKNYFKRSIPYFKSSGNINQLINAYITLADIYKTSNQMDSAQIMVDEAFTVTMKNHLSDNYCTVYWFRGLMKQNPEEALKDYMLGLKFAHENKNDFYVNQISFSIAECYLKMGNSLEATKYADAILETSNGDLSIDMRCYKLLYQVNQKAGDYKNALHYHELFTRMQDSIFNGEKNKTVEELNTKYETGKKEHQIALLGKDNELHLEEISRQKLMRNATIGGLGVVLCFLAVVFLQKKRISKEKARSEELLLNILPYETAQELKAKGSADAQLFDEVTVLFTDFKGFTAVAEELSPKELVAEIHECFKTFDDIMGRYDIEKIKTIGDAYMAAGGLPVANKTNAEDVVNAAIEIRDFMISYASKRRQQNKSVFEVRIGIHTGPVVAGIVGVKKFQYDIWGDTVNTASRMESSGRAGHVNISQRTHEVIKNNSEFEFESRGAIEAKGKGMLEMYFVTKKAGNIRPNGFTA